MSASTAEHQKTTIRQLFTRIAGRYDLVNQILSLGQDRRWRQEALALAQVPAGGWMLDVATGTGEVSMLAQSTIPEVQIVGVDLTQAMLTVAQQKDRRQSGIVGQTVPVHWMVCDGLSLAFPDDTFDAVISVFMMRNVPDIAQALAEQWRVVRSGGRVVCLEMTWPRCFPISELFKLYFFGWAPLVGWLLSGDREAYTYLPRSVHSFLAPDALAEKMTQVGLRDVTWITKMFGTVILHIGIK
ncbi:MAG: ubiquinone/menaquinone biosynthesis methyltransferase [Anaerolineae bacterium]|nr:ubiquinone/menaquinone biosynthesis methyltransferase [Anaerolineae bacterium]